MKKYIIAIDGGTTNTRASLWQDPGVCVDMVKSDIGVRITSIEGSNDSLRPQSRVCWNSCWKTTRSVMMPSKAFTPAA